MRRPLGALPIENSVADTDLPLKGLGCGGTDRVCGRCCASSEVRETSGDEQRGVSPSSYPLPSSDRVLTADILKECRAEPVFINLSRKIDQRRFLRFVAQAVEPTDERGRDNQWRMQLIIT